VVRYTDDAGFVDPNDRCCRGINRSVVISGLGHLEGIHWSVMLECRTELNAMRASRYGRRFEG
jgi:hypothetical protein